MALFRYNRYRRLEPRQPYSALAQGFEAEVADPLWFLGRQWQMGEHEGEDASSPVEVLYRMSGTPVDPVQGDAAYDPATTPPEAVVESESGDWWTAGRRVRIGMLLAAAMPPLANADPDLLLAALPAPYHHLEGRGYDGLALWRRRVQLGLDGHAAFASVPLDPQDFWDPAELVYAADFSAGGRTLRAPRHAGGRLDWYSVDADGPVPAPAPLPAAKRALASRLRYAGAPATRWWEIESHKVDIGGFPPDRSHFATLLLIDLVASHSDDWFGFSMTVPTGQVVTLHELQIRDSFGDVWTVQQPVNWTMFSVQGLDHSSLLVWPAVTTPLSGIPLEDVVLGIDEDANALFAVERRLGGRDVATRRGQDSQTATGGATDGTVSANAQDRYEYRASSNIPERWHPYVIENVGGRRRFVQARFADLDTDPVGLKPEAEAAVLSDPATIPGGPVHQLEPATVPINGLRLERRWKLARRTDGTPILWMQRRRLPLLSPPALSLDFDTMEPVPTVIPTN